MNITGKTNFFFLSLVETLWNGNFCVINNAGKNLYFIVLRKNRLTTNDLCIGVYCGKICQC